MHCLGPSRKSCWPSPLQRRDAYHSQMEGGVSRGIVKDVYCRLYIRRFGHASLGKVWPAEQWEPGSQIVQAAGGATMLEAAGVWKQNHVPEVQHAWIPYTSIVKPVPQKL